MTTRRRRVVSAVATSLTLGAFACSERSRDMADTMTTPTMRRELSSDLRAAEQALQQIQDSVDVALGPELATRLRPLREAFVTYRKQQCELLKEVFKDGTYGPVAELECLIHLTDSRREFIEENYDFIEKIGGAGAGSGTTTPARGAGRAP